MSPIEKKNFWNKVQWRKNMHTLGEKKKELQVGLEPPISTSPQPSPRKNKSSSRAVNLWIETIEPEELIDTISLGWIVNVDQKLCPRTYIVLDQKLSVGPSHYEMDLKNGSQKVPETLS